MMNNVTKVLKWQAGSVKATHRGWTVGPLWQELPPCLQCPQCPQCQFDFERRFIRKSSFISFEMSTAVVAAAALTSGATSAQMFNAYQFDQMKAPATKTRAAVRAEVASAVSDRRRRGLSLPLRIRKPPAGQPVKPRCVKQLMGAAFSKGLRSPLSGCGSSACAPHNASSAA